MKFLSRLASFIKSSPTTQPLISMALLGQAVWTHRDYKKLADEGYIKNVVGFKAVNEIANGASQIKWTLFRKDSKDEKIQIKNHPILDLMRNPNKTQGGASLIKEHFSFLLISGNSYWEFLDDSKGMPKELNILRPDRMMVIAGDTGPDGYEYTVNGTAVKWYVDKLTGESPILHAKSFSPLDDWYGLSSIEPAAYNIDIFNSILNWFKALLDNRAQPSGALVYDPKEGSANLSDEEYNRLKKQLDSMSGSDNVGKPMLLEGGLKWVEMGMSPQKMDYLNGKDSAARDIAMAFGVPGQVLGLPGDSTFNSMKEARLSMWDNTILPLLWELVDDLNRWLIPRFPQSEGLFLSFDEDAISALAPRRDALWDRIQSSNFLTVNEKRLATGYGAIDGGNDVLINANLIPIGAELEDLDSKELDRLLNENIEKTSRIAYGK